MAKFPLLQACLQACVYFYSALNFFDLALASAVLDSPRPLSSLISFKPVRRPNVQPLPIDTNNTFRDSPTDDIIPHFIPNTAYTYQILLNATSEIYSFNPNTADEQTGDIAAVDASGFAANATVTLVINALPESPYPDTILFSAFITTVYCDVARGQPVGQTGREMLRDSTTTGKPCVPSLGTPESPA